MTYGTIIIPGCIKTFIIHHHHSGELFGYSISLQFLKRSRIHSNRFILIPKASAYLESKYLRIINLDIVLWIGSPNNLTLSIF